MSIFSKIISGEIPCYKIAENDEFIAFLDIMPVQKGHTLIVPKIVIDQFWEMPLDLMQRLMAFAQPISQSIVASFDCNRCGTSIIGLEVPHAHMHLIPINTLNDMDFKAKRLELSPEEMTMIQKRIIQNIK